MYGVYFVKESGEREYIRVFEHEIDAADFCDYYDGRITGADGFLHEIDYCEV